MNDFLWKKTTTPTAPDEAIMAFLAGEDIVLDRVLLLFDLQASAAHARGLKRIGVLTGEELHLVEDALADFARDFESGKRTLGAEFEDGHSAIEHWLTDELGDLGRKIHTGRSRNDQVAVALRLYMKAQLADLGDLCAEVAGVLLERASAEAELPFPGYTHLQRAMPSSAGLWLAGHAEAYIDNLELAQHTRRWLDASPLGTASGFGVNLALPRQEVAEDLGFSRWVVNPQCAQNSRGKVELQAIGALGAATLDLQRMAWDLSLFTTQEFDFIRLPERYCTGSSIMPNKRNPDVVELLRAVHARIVGSQVELQGLLSLPSGYQRDLQATKPPLIRSFEMGLRALRLLPGLLRDFEWRPERMREAITAELHATDRATALAASGVPFRKAYQRVSENLDGNGGHSVEQSLRERISPGASGDLRLDLLKERLDQFCQENP